MRRVTCDFPGATRDLQEALLLYRGLDERLGQGNALTRLGDVRRATGAGVPAVLAHGGGARLGALLLLRLRVGLRADARQEALQLFRDLDERLGQANTLTQLGYVRRLTGDLEAAARDQQQALQRCCGLRG